MTEQEFTRLFTMYRSGIYRLAYCSLRDPADADDVTQDVFLRLYTKAPELSSDEDVKAWLIRVTINRCRDSLRSMRRKATEPITDILCTADAEEHRLLSIVMQLSPKLRTVMYMYYYEEYSIKEIAKLLGIKETAVSSRLMRGRDKLRQLIEKEGI